MSKRFIAMALLTAASALGCGDETELTIFHTNDIHSHLKVGKIDPFGLGGLARLSTLLTKLRATAPVSLTIDGGDYSEGTWYFDVDAGTNMLRLLEAMNYDAVALGNHDFLTGPRAMIDSISAANAHYPVLAANLDVRAYDHGTELARWVPGYVIKQVGNLKVGIVGLTTFEPMYQSYIQPVVITEPIAAANAVIKALKHQTDLIVLVSHNSFGTNLQFAREIPGVNVVVSGHSHHKTPRAVIVTNAGRDVPVVEAGEWGKFLGDLKLTVNRSNHLVKIKSFQLHPVDSTLAEDPVVAGIVAEQDRALEAKYGRPVDEVVAHAEIDLVQNDNHETALGNLAVKAYRAATGSDLSMEEISLTGVSIPKGPVTVMDLHDVVPHIYNPATGKDWTLHVWNARGEDLSLLLNIFYTVTGLVPLSSPLGWLSTDNVSVIWEPGTKSVPAIKLVKIGDRALEPSARYTVTLADGMLLAIRLINEKFHLGVDLSQIEDRPTEVWTAILKYAGDMGTLTRADFGIGGKARTQSPDLAVYGYGLDWDGHALSIEVQNQGLSVSTAAKLTCSTGINDGVVAYGTDEQVWTQVGQVDLAPLASDASLVVTIPWERAGLAPGYWPVECHVSGGGDKYPGNDSTERVFKK